MLAVDDAVASGDQLRRYGRGEDGVVGKVGEHLLDVVVVPGTQPAVGESPSFSLVHSSMMGERTTLRSASHERRRQGAHRALEKVRPTRVPFTLAASEA